MGRALSAVPTATAVGATADLAENENRPVGPDRSGGDAGQGIGLKKQPFGFGEITDLG
jgi:hypothetical protein